MEKKKEFCGRFVVCKFKYLNDLSYRTKLEECQIRTIRGHIDHFTGNKFIIFDEGGRLHIIHIELVVEMHEYETDN